MLAVASAGWIFDVYEGQLFTIFKTPMLARADRRRRPGRSTGRRTSASRPSCWAARWAGWSSASSATASAASGSCRRRSWSTRSSLRSPPSPDDVAGPRAPVPGRAGTGGEWAVAAALVAETFPHAGPGRGLGTVPRIERHRRRPGVGDGPDLRAARRLALRLSWSAWLPSLLVVWIRASLREPKPTTESETRARAAPTSVESAGRTRQALAELLGRPLWRIARPARPGPGRRRAGDVLGHLRLGTRAGRPGRSARSAPAESKQAASSLAYLLMNFTGGLLGLLSFAPLANRLGRRGAFAVYHVGAGDPRTVTFLGDHGLRADALPALADGVLRPRHARRLRDLFPRAVPHPPEGHRRRASASTWAGSWAPSSCSIRGELGEHLGMPRAAAVISCLFWVGLVILWFTPETRGRELPE